MVDVSLEEVKGIKYLGIVSGKVHYLSDAANICRIVPLISGLVFFLCLSRYAASASFSSPAVFFLCSSYCNCMDVFLLFTISVEFWKCSVFFEVCSNSEFILR